VSYRSESSVFRSTVFISGDKIQVFLQLGIWTVPTSDRS